MFPLTVTKMNAKKLNEILPIALQKGYLKPTNVADPCFIDSLNKANLILWHLLQSDGQGLEMAQMAHRVEMSEHTVLQYVARLVDLRLVTKMVKPGENGKGIWFLAELGTEEKSESRRTIKSVKAAIS